MTLSVRLAALADEEAIVELVAAMMEETRPGEPYERDVIRERLRDYLDADDAAVWVAERNKAIVGFMLATIILFDWRAGCCTLARMRYAVGGDCGAGSLDLLAQAFLAWSRDRGAEEVFGLNFDPQHAAITRQALGAQKLGHPGLQ